VKTFACGDVVPGCTHTFSASNEDDLVALVAEHAAADHDMSEIPAAVVEQVRAHIVTI
jgi:predicted small metal-binding protein